MTTRLLRRHPHSPLDRGALHPGWTRCARTGSGARQARGRRKLKRYRFRISCSALHPAGGHAPVGWRHHRNHRRPGRRGHPLRVDENRPAGRRQPGRLQQPHRSRFPRCATRGTAHRAGGVGGDTRFSCDDSGEKTRIFCRTRQPSPTYLPHPIPPVTHTPFSPGRGPVRTPKTPTHLMH